MQRSDVAAGIVTYNPEPERLLQNIRAAKEQLQRLLVFDNGSSNVSEWRDAAVAVGVEEIVAAGENLGMAKALNALARRFKADDCKAALWLDQDSVASLGMVNLQLQAVEALEQEEAPWGMVAATMRTSGSLHDPAPSDPEPSLVMDGRLITSGSLVNLNAWEAVGGYDERLFLDWVDFEFCDALRAAGYALVRVRDAVLSHELGAPVLAFELPFALAGRSDGRYYASNRPYSRWYDRFRSIAIARETYRGTPIGTEERRQCLTAFLRGVLVEPNRQDVLRGFVRGTLDGRHAARQPRPAGAGETHQGA